MARIVPRNGGTARYFVREMLKKISRTFAALAPFRRRNANKVPEGAREVLRRGEPEPVGGVLHRKAIFKKSLSRLYPALKKESVGRKPVRRLEQGDE
jgi:hypothetical protein